MSVVSSWFWVLLCRFVSRCDGNIALIFSLVLPVLIGLAGLGIDSAAFYNQQSRMQSAADSSSLAIGKEMHLFIEDPETLKEAGKTRVETLLATVGIAQRPHTTEVRLDTEKGTAQVEIAMEAKGFLPMEVWGANPIRVTSTAMTYGELKLCVLGLHSTGRDTIKIEHGALVTASGCGVQSNSTHPAGLSSGDTSVIVSAATCTSGGYEGSASSFAPTPLTDCPIVEDPLALRPPPTVGGCDFLDFKSEKGRSDGRHTLLRKPFCEARA